MNDIYPSEKPAFIFMAGSSGHTGSRLAARLLELGWQLKCLSHREHTRGRIPEHTRCEIVSGDLHRPETYTESLRGAHACLNLAHIRHIVPLIEACKAVGVNRLLATSSTRRFTRFPDPSAQRVIAAEAAIAISDLDFTVLRPTMIFGGSNDNNLEKVFAWLRRHRWLPLVAGGRGKLQPIYVHDLVAAFVTALEHPETTSGKMLTVAGSETKTQKDLFIAIGEAIGRPTRFIPVPYPLMMSAAWLAENLISRPPLSCAQVRRMLEDKVFDISEARAALPGWEPRTLNEALAEKSQGKA